MQDPAIPLSADLSFGRIARVLSGTLVGLQGLRVRVEVDVAAGLPGFSLVGLPSAALRESRERVGAALRHSGYRWPDGRVTVSLAPADRRKDGAAMDLAIAVALLLATGQVPRPPADWLRRTLFVGELALDGALRPARGVLALGLDAGRLGVDRLVAPAAQSAELGLVPGSVRAIALDHLRQLPRVLRRRGPDRFGAPARGPDPRWGCPRLAEVCGQAPAKRALVLAAAGGHHLLLQGPPGCGKSMLARKLVELLPPLEGEIVRDRLRILSATGSALDPGGATRPPLRAPHHTVSAAGLVGGGTVPRPGEITLAHGGVLFLDEINEFGAERLDRLREALGTGEIRHARLGESLRFPARFQLVGAGNPCPCGWAGSALDRCRCTPHEIARHRRRLSGPLCDRIDLWVDMDREPAERMWSEGEEDANDAGLLRAVARARRRGGSGTNAALDGERLFARCALDLDAKGFLARLADRHGLSARALTGTLRVARTIADLEGRTRVERKDLAEAFTFRLPGLSRWGEV